MKTKRIDSDFIAIRLFLDENFPLPVVEALRQLGHDIVTIQESGKANQAFPDDAVLRLASENQRVVITINRKDFIGLHKISSAHEGIIVCTADVDFTGQAQRIHDAIGTAEPLVGKLIRVNRATA